MIQPIYIEIGCTIVNNYIMVYKSTLEFSEQLTLLDEITIYNIKMDFNCEKEFFIFI